MAAIFWVALAGRTARQVVRRKVASSQTVTGWESLADVPLGKSLSPLDVQGQPPIFQLQRNCGGGAGKLLQHLCRSVNVVVKACVDFIFMSKCQNHNIALAACGFPPTWLEEETEALKCLTTAATDVGDNDATQHFSNCSFME